MRRTVNLSSFRFMALHIGSIEDNSMMYAFILSRLRFSISLWFCLKIQEKTIQWTAKNFFIYHLKHSSNLSCIKFIKYKVSDPLNFFLIPKNYFKGSKLPPVFNISANTDITIFISYADGHSTLSIDFSPNKNCITLKLKCFFK